AATLKALARLILEWGNAMTKHEESMYLKRFEGFRPAGKRQELRKLELIAIQGNDPACRKALTKMALIAGASKQREDGLRSLREVHNRRPLEAETALFKAAQIRANSPEDMHLAQGEERLKSTAGEFPRMDQIGQLHAVDVEGHASIMHGISNSSTLLLRALEPGNSEVVRQRAALYALHIYTDMRRAYAKEPEIRDENPNAARLYERLRKRWGKIIKLAGAAVEGSHATNRLLAAMALEQHPVESLKGSLANGILEEIARRKAKEPTHPLTLSVLRKAFAAADKQKARG
ncbi:MAG: hypothetical protein V1708_02095, partial [Candidatus Micrarchaeota archaeon]